MTPIQKLTAILEGILGQAPFNIRNREEVTPADVSDL